MAAPLASVAGLEFNIWLPVKQRVPWALHQTLTDTGWLQQQWVPIPAPLLGPQPAAAGASEKGLKDS